MLSVKVQRSRTLLRSTPSSTILRTSRRRWLFFNISEATSKVKKPRTRMAILHLKSKPQHPQEIFVNLHRLMSRNGWEPSMPSCSEWAAKSSKSYSKTKLRSFWAQNSKLWHTSIRNKRDSTSPCLVHCRAAIKKCQRDLNTPKTF